MQLKQERLQMKTRRFVLTVLAILVILPGFIRAEVAAQLPDVMKPTFMAIDNDNIYIVDGATIWIYGMNDYKLKGKFGKKGEGPQEFRLTQGGLGGMVFPQKDSLAVNTPGKLSIWTKDGKFIREYKGPPNMAQGSTFLQPVGDRFVGIGGTFDQKTITFSMEVTIYDGNMEKKKELNSMPFMKNSKMNFPFKNPSVYVYDNKIVTTGGDTFSFNITVFDPDGNVKAEIKREYQPLKVYDGYKEEVYEMMRRNPDTKNFFDLVKKMVEFGDKFPPIQQFYVADNNVYIQTYKKQDGKYEFFVYRLDGKLITQVFLPVSYMWGIMPNPTAVKNNTLYQLLENEDEEVWELNATKIM